MRLDAIGIVCSDLEASLRFYSMLGVPLPRYDDTNGHYEAQLDGGFRLMLDGESLIASLDDGFTPTSGSGRVVLAVRCRTPAAVDAAHGDVVSAGFRSVREPFDAVWGQRYATVADPDGNPIDLYADLQGQA